MAESVYSVMKCQAKAGGQDLSTLEQRTKLDWHLPATLRTMPNTVQAASRRWLQAGHHPLNVAHLGETESIVLDRLMREETASKFPLLD